MGVEIEVVDAILSRERQDSMSDSFLRGSTENIFRYSNTNVPNFQNMFRRELGVTGGTVQVCDIDHP